MLKCKNKVKKIKVNENVWKCKYQINKTCVHLTFQKMPYSIILSTHCVQHIQPNFDCS